MWGCTWLWKALHKIHDFLISDNSFFSHNLLRPNLSEVLSMFRLWSKYLVRTKSDWKNQGSSSKWGITMETNQLCLHCLLWPFLFCHRLFRRSGSTMLHSLELSAMCSSTVFNTIDRLSCLVLVLENLVAVGALAQIQYHHCRFKFPSGHQFLWFLAWFYQCIKKTDRTSPRVISKMRLLVYITPIITPGGY